MSGERISKAGDSVESVGIAAVVSNKNSDANLYIPTSTAKLRYLASSLRFTSALVQISLITPDICTVNAIHW